MRCKGFDDADDDDAGSEYVGGELKIRGTRAVVEANADALREQQAAQGMTPGAWVLPVYCHDDFQTDRMMPFFFSPLDLAAGWRRSGRDKEAIPEQLAVMELRVLVKQMETTDAFNWDIFQFVSSEEAYMLASEIIAQKGVSGQEDADEDGDSAPAAASGSAVDADDVDDDEVLD